MLIRRFKTPAGSRWQLARPRVRRADRGAGLGFAQGLSADGRRRQGGVVLAPN